MKTYLILPFIIAAAQGMVIKATVEITEPDMGLVAIDEEYNYASGNQQSLTSHDGFSSYANSAWWFFGCSDRGCGNRNRKWTYEPASGQPRDDECVAIVGATAPIQSINMVHGPDSAPGIWGFCFYSDAACSMANRLTANAVMLPDRNADFCYAPPAVGTTIRSFKRTTSGFCF